jgi:inner membrane protein
MTAKGHVLLAMPLAIVGVDYLALNQINGALFIISVTIGALFPDIDEPGSYIGRRLWFMSWFVKILSLFFPYLKHRGVTHFFVIPFTMIIVATFFKNIWLAGFALGWLLHTVGDLLTVGGIRGYLYPLWPNQKIVLLPDGIRFYTGKFAEQVFNTTLLLFNGYLLAHFQGIL